MMLLNRKKRDNNIKIHYSKIYNPLINFKILNFLDIQRKSFKYFLNKGLIEEFKNLKKITNSTKTIEILFYIEKYKLTKPKWTIRQSIFKKKNYSCQLFIPLQIINHNNKESILDWLLLMNLPLMTKNGHFIINGSPKIIMNQIIRSPGIYFQKLIKQDQQIFYSADFIAQRGTWLRLEIDSKSGEIWAKMKKTSKIPIFIFLRCLGISLPIFNNYLKLYKSNLNIEYKINKLLLNKKKNKINLPIFNKNFIFLDKKNVYFNNLNYNFNELFKKISLKLKEDDNINLKKMGKKFLYEKFLNPRLYNLSKLGRLRINKRLGINISKDHTLLTAKDILFSCFYLIQCLKGIEITTDIDNLKNRQIRSSGQLIQIQLSTAILKFEKIIRDKLILNEKFNKPKNIIFRYNKLKNGFIINQYIPNSILLVKKDEHILLNKNYYINKKFNFNIISNLKKINYLNLIKLNNYYNKRNLIYLSYLNLGIKIFKFKNKTNIDLKLDTMINSKLFNNVLREFFNTNPLVQLLDQTNPLAEITHKRRLSSLGPGGISRDTAGMAIRGIHPTHYGRICPIETPEGQNAGLVNSFTIYSNLNSKGFIETPFYKIYKGFVQINLGLFLFSSDQEKNCHIAPGDIKKNLLNFLPNKIDIPCRQLKEFKRIPRNQMDYIAINPIQMISIATSLIPFLEHNDGNRALMGSNMQRQAVPILKPNFPIVGTGLESKIIANINYGIQAKFSGLVTYIDGQKIIISSFKKNLLNPLIYYSLEPLSKFKNIFYKVLKKKNKLKTKITNNNILYQYIKLKNKNLLINKKINSNVFNFNKFIYLIPLLNTQKKNLKKKSLVILFLCISKKNSSFFSINFFKKLNKNDKFVFYNIKNREYFKINNFALVSTKSTYTIFNLNFKNSIFSIFQIIKYYSNKPIYYNKKSKIKKFISKNNLFVLKQFKNINIITNYSKLILNKSPLTNYILTSILINFKNKIYLKKIKYYKILLPIYFKILLNKIHLPYNFYLIKNKITKRKIIFNNLNNINKKNYYLYFWNKKNDFYKIKKFNLFKTTNFNLKINKTYKNKYFLHYIYLIYINSFYFKFFNLYNLKNKYNYLNLFNLKLNKINKKQLINIKYNCDKFSRSNQDTYLVHRPIVKIGQWVQYGDILADNSTSSQGELAIGQNILIGYLPWEGYNFEDAVLINQRLVYDDIFTSLHIERYETEIKETKFGSEEMTYKLNEKNLINILDKRGIIRLGTWVKEGDILVGKTSPVGKKKLSAYEKLLYDIIGKSIPNKKDTSLRVPLGIKGRVVNIEVIEKDIYSVSNKTNNIKCNKKLYKNFFIYKFLKKKKIKLKIKKNNFINKNLFFITKTKKLKNRIQTYFYLKNYYNYYYKNKIIYFNKRHKILLKLSTNIKNFLIKQKNKNLNEIISLKKRKKVLLFPIFIILKKNLLKIKYLKIFHNSFLLNNLNYINFFNNNIFYFLKNQNINFFTTYLYNIIFKNKLKNHSTKLSFINEFLYWLKKNELNYIINNKKEIISKIKKPIKILIYIAEKRKIQIGDKISGRHGNKGIISNILPSEDMPYLPDGQPLDLVLNPLGVPSRMNVGQIFESLLGLAGMYLNQCYKIQPFDEIYGSEASQSLVYSKLYEAQIKTGQYWLFNPNCPGKIKLFDGRTGNCFEQPSTIGKAYILKLIHQVDEKIHARSTGPYSLITQQPLRGRSKQGGQRVGEMEVWALEGFGASYILQEILTIKSDDIDGRNQLTKSILNNKPIKCGTPESFKVLIRELQALCLDISIYKSKSTRKFEKLNINF